MVRCGPDDDGLDAPGDGGEIGVRHPSGDLGGGRVDGEDLVAALQQPIVDDVAAVATRGAGDPGDGDPTAGEELVRGLLDGDHEPSRFEATTRTGPPQAPGRSAAGLSSQMPAGF
jgi:hypothetical protein